MTEAIPILPQIMIACQVIGAGLAMAGAGLLAVAVLDLIKRRDQ